MLRSCLSLLGILLLVNAFFIAFALSIGALLHWLIPAIEFGVGALLGLISLLGSLYLVFVAFAPPPNPGESLIELRPIDVIIPTPRRRRNNPPAP